MTIKMIVLILSALEILQLVAGAEEGQRELRARYTYREVQENWRLDPYGRPIAESHRTKGFEVLMVNGQRYRKLLERNGKPLNAAEQWEVEHDMNRVQEQKQEAKSLRNLARTHALSLRGGGDEPYVLSARSEGESHEIRLDSKDFGILRQETISSKGTRMVLEFVRQSDGVYLPLRVEVEFQVGDVRGLQVSKFSNFTAN